MNLYLMRHGEADFCAENDASRNLTPSGCRYIETKIAKFKNELKDIDCIIHSPYLRAVQTAKIVAGALDIQALTSLTCWTPESNPKEALQSLEPYADQRVLVVTHMPLIGAVEALLCEGDYRYSRGYSCAEIAKLKVDWPATGLGSLLKQY